MRIATLAGLLLAVAGAAEAQPAQFDLNCALKTRTEASGVTATDDETHSYRIDLVRRVYCRDGCAPVEVRPIADIRPDVLELENRNSKPPPPDHGVMLMSVDRRTLTYRGSLEISRAHFRVASEGPCQLAPFSGIPEKGQ